VQRVTGEDRLRVGGGVGGDQAVAAPADLEDLLEPEIGLARAAQAGPVAAAEHVRDAVGIEEGGRRARGVERDDAPERHGLGHDRGRLLDDAELDSAVTTSGWQSASTTRVPTPSVTLVLGLPSHERWPRRASSASPSRRREIMACASEIRPSGMRRAHPHARPMR
jgi:hypothetical protein